MDRRSFVALAGAAAVGLAGCTDRAAPATDTTETADGTRVRVESVVTGLSSPWAVAPLPDGRALVTEQGGRLVIADPESGERTEVPGAPEVFARGQGGLLDATLAADFPDSRLVYLTYSVSGDGGSSTRVGRGRLDGERLADFEPLYTARPFVRSSGHYGSRVVDDGDHLFVTVGDRQFKDFGPDHVGQTLDDDLGSVLRLGRDGTVPDDNPFADREGASDAVYSYGHRNPQGLALRANGALWESEFGERAGDELNVVEAGANYGWPVADEGCRYGTNDPVGVPHDEREDVVGPVYSWPCGGEAGGFPPSGMTFYDGDALSAWDGDLFVGGLASQYLARFTVEGEGQDAVVTERSPLLADRGWRVRDVAVGADGALLAVVDAGDAPLVRLSPA
ncbi:PQQ-dependent sugar dehydrogenase [Halosegnis marinus]|uniref:PQQ-dependent sugar dehydrogenase n=1 Tax=Halosegnis marinus TaxID=3034023 RepID=A0ABD5ZQR1_9EURY|nr:PQQ-dependent sugar dehydrogenase [Halosegnis sp. DT85]